MLFNSYQFLFIFLPIALLIYYFVNLKKPKYSYLAIFIFSVIFYGIWDLKFLILIFISILINYRFGTLLKENKNKIYLLIGIIFQLFILGYFKYKNFFLENYNLLTASNFQVENIILPLGISFFTFKHILYLIECYNSHYKTTYTLLNYATYITFFPHLIAGPLSKPKEIIPQLIKNSPITFHNLNIGLSIFFIGLFKKIILADTFAGYSEDPFNAVENGYDISLFESWIAMICFSFQIYFDFSGYTDMAVGLAKIFNISFPVNFYSPYKSHSIIEFWRKWHMTLSRFLKECIYIPLGGNRKGKILSYFFILFTMLLGGFWHGASWNFILWGFFHAVLIIFNHLIIYINNNKPSKNYIIRFIKLISTFIFVCFGWVIFKLDSLSSIQIFFQGLFGFNGVILNPNLERIFLSTSIIDLINIEFRNIYYYGTSQLIFVGIGFFIIFFLPNTIQIMSHYNTFLPNSLSSKIKYKKKQLFLFKFNKKWSILLAFIAVCAITGLSNETKEFIYYQF